MDELGGSSTTETDMVADVLRSSFIREAIGLVTGLPTSDVEAAIADLTAERVGCLATTVSVMINRRRNAEVVDKIAHVLYWEQDELTSTERAALARARDVCAERTQVGGEERQLEPAT